MGWPWSPLKPHFPPDSYSAANHTLITFYGFITFCTHFKRWWRFLYETSQSPSLLNLAVFVNCWLSPTVPYLQGQHKDCLQVSSPSEVRVISTFPIFYWDVANTMGTFQGHQLWRKSVSPCFNLSFYLFVSIILYIDEFFQTLKVGVRVRAKITKPMQSTGLR